MKNVYILSNAIELTWVLNAVHINTEEICVCADYDLSLVDFCCEKIVVQDKFVVVKQIDAKILENADVIYISPCGNIKSYLINRYHITNLAKIKTYELPQGISLIEYNGESSFNVPPKADLTYKREWMNQCEGLPGYLTSCDLDEKEIPFILEPRLELLNKNQTEKYYTYSIARRNYEAGIYFDNEKIKQIKEYDKYNATVKVVVYGKVCNKSFVDESIILYGAIYGEDKVELVEDVGDYEFNSETNYLLLPVSVRMNSPFIIKYFSTYNKKNNKVGIVAPNRTGESENKILYGNGKGIAEILKVINELKNEAWYDYVIDNCIVADMEMFNVMFEEKVVLSNTTEKKKYISYLEWIRNAR